MLKKKYVLSDPRAPLYESELSNTGLQKIRDQQQLVAEVYGTTDRETGYAHALKEVKDLEIKKQTSGTIVFRHDELRLLKVLLDRSVLVLLEPENLAEFEKAPRYSTSNPKAHDIHISRLKNYLEAGRRYMAFLQDCQAMIDERLPKQRVKHLKQLIERVSARNICKDALMTISNSLKFILETKDVRVMEQPLREVMFNLEPLEKTYRNKTDSSNKALYEDILELMQIFDLCKIKSLMPSVYDESAQNCEMVFNQSNTFMTYTPNEEQTKLNLSILREVLLFEDSLLAALEPYSNSTSSWPAYHPNSGRMQTRDLQNQPKKTGGSTAYAPALTVLIIRMQLKKTLWLKSEAHVPIIRDLTIGKILLIELRTTLDREVVNHTYAKATVYLERLDSELQTAKDLFSKQVFQDNEILQLNAFEYVLEIRNTKLNQLVLFQHYQPKPEEVEEHNSICGIIGTASSTMYILLQQQKADFLAALTTIKLVGDTLNTPNNRVLKEFFQLYHNITIVFLLMQNALDYYEVIYRHAPENDVDFKMQLVKEQIELIKLIQELLTSMEKQFGQKHLMKFYIKHKDGHSVLIDILEMNDARQRAGNTSKVYLGKKIQLVREYYEGVELGLKKLLSELSAGQRDVTTADYLNSFGAILPDELEELLKQDEEERAQKKLHEEKQKPKKKNKHSRAKQLESKTSPDTQPFVNTVTVPAKTSLVPKCDAELRREFDNLLETLYTKQFDFNGFRSMLSALPKLINQAQNLELVFEVNSAMGDAYDMMARKIHLSSKTPVTRDSSGRPNGVRRKPAKTYDYSKMASETISCLEASVNYYKYAEIVLQKLHGKIPEEQYNLKYQWLIICMEERTVKLRELRQRFTEDAVFLRQRGARIRAMQGETLWKSRNNESYIARYRKALDQCSEPFAEITRTLEAFTAKIAKHRLVGEPRPALDCAYVSHQYASQTKELPSPDDRDFSHAQDAAKVEEPYELEAEPASNEASELEAVARVEPQAVDNGWLQTFPLPRPLTFHPPFSFPFPGMPPVLFFTGTFVPQQVQPQFGVSTDLVPHLRNPLPPQLGMPPVAMLPQLGMPPFAYGHADYNYNTTGYVAPMYAQPQMQIMCVLPSVVYDEQQQGFAQRQ